VFFRSYFSWGMGYFVVFFYENSEYVIILNLHLFFTTNAFLFLGLNQWYNDAAKLVNPTTCTVDKRTAPFPQAVRCSKLEIPDNLAAGNLGKNRGGRQLAVRTLYGNSQGRIGE